VAVGAAELVAEGVHGRVEEALAAALRRQRYRVAQRDGGGDRRARRVHHRNGVVEPVGHIQRRAIRRDLDVARVRPTGTCASTYLDEAERSFASRAAWGERAAATSFARSRMRTSFRAAGGDVGALLVARDGHAEGQGREGLHLVQGHLHHPADGVAKHRQRISQHPAVLHVGQRDQVLGRISAASPTRPSGEIAT